MQKILALLSIYFFISVSVLFAFPLKFAPNGFFGGFFGNAPNSTYEFFWELSDSLDESSGMSGTVTRTSTATYIDTDGVLQTVSANQPRFETNGLLSEGEGTNYCLQNNDMTEGVWTATNITPLKNVVGVDGVTDSASRLTATAGNGTILQTITTLASATHIYSVWLKRITGTGNIDLTDNNGTNWTTKTLTSEWQRFNITRSQTDPIVGIRIVTSGDVIAAQYNQVEASQAYMTSAIPTEAIPVTRTADSHSWTMSTAFKNLMGDVADSPFTMVVEWTPKFDYGDCVTTKGIISVRGAAESLLGVNLSGNMFSYGGAYSIIDPDYTTGTTYIFALRIYDDAGTMKIVVGEKHGGSWTWDASPGNYGGNFLPDTNLVIGRLAEYPFNIKNIYFYGEKTQAWIEDEYESVGVVAMDYDAVWDGYASTWTNYTETWE